VPGPSLAPFGALTFTYFAAIGLFNPYAPLWFQSLGLSTLMIGGIVSLQSWTRVLAPYAWSWAGDHSGQRVKLIRIAAAGALASALGLLGVTAAVPVAVVTVVLFVANSGVVPLYEALLARALLTPDGGIDARRYGRVRVWDMRLANERACVLSFGGFHGALSAEARAARAPRHITPSGYARRNG
jgi:PPP family 3-phenylpropionic acid transporter